MTNLWGTLAPLIIGSAVVPIQIVITILLLRSNARVTAVAWVAGMTAARLVQGVVFGLLVARDSDATTTTGEGQPSPLTSSLLLVVGLILLVMALRAGLNQPDEDAPPPQWLTLTETMGAGRAFLLGAALIAVGAKFWVFTLAAISAIGDAGLGQGASILVFLLFVALAEGVVIGVLVVAFAAPTRADALLSSASAWFEAHNRVIVIVLGVVFGAWFLAKGLAGLGLL